MSSLRTGEKQIGFRMGFKLQSLILARGVFSFRIDKNSKNYSAGLNNVPFNRLHSVYAYHKDSCFRYLMLKISDVSQEFMGTGSVTGLLSYFPESFELSSCPVEKKKKNWFHL